jgi:hypothetical protein
MKPYSEFHDRDASHPNGKPTPKYARKRADKKAARAIGKKACKDS